jgi:hypothetical protein
MPRALQAAEKGMAMGTAVGLLSADVAEAVAAVDGLPGAALYVDFTGISSRSANFG